MLYHRCILMLFFANFESLEAKTYQEWDNKLVHIQEKNPVGTVKKKIQIYQHNTFIVQNKYKTT